MMAFYPLAKALDNKPEEMPSDGQWLCFYVVLLVLWLVVNI
jgi:uncharacterized membrane protein